MAPILQWQFAYKVFWLKFYWNLVLWVQFTNIWILYKYSIYEITGLDINPCTTSKFINQIQCIIIGSHNLRVLFCFCFCFWFWFWGFFSGLHTGQPIPRWWYTRSKYIISGSSWDTHRHPTKLRICLKEGELRETEKVRKREDRSI